MNPTPAPTQNAVHCIFPYRHPKSPNLWVFDDGRFGLHEEPFVLGASEAIERIVQKRGLHGTRIMLHFSVTPMPKADAVLHRRWRGVSPEISGCEYHDGTEALWLCPAMVHYFGGGMAPEEIYVRAEAAGAS